MDSGFRIDDGAPVGVDVSGLAHTSISVALVSEGGWAVSVVLFIRPYDGVQLLFLNTLTGLNMDRFKSPASLASNRISRISPRLPVCQLHTTQQHQGSDQTFITKYHLQWMQTVPSDNSSRDH